MNYQIGTPICFGIHDRKLTFVPLGTSWHEVMLREYATYLYIKRGYIYECWVLSPRGDGYMAPNFRIGFPCVREVRNEFGDIIDRVFL